MKKKGKKPRPIGTNKENRPTQANQEGLIISDTESVSKKLYQDGWTQEVLAGLAAALISPLINYFASETKGQFISVATGFVILVCIVAWMAVKRDSSEKHKRSKIIWTAVIFSVTIYLLTYVVYLKLTTTPPVLTSPTFRQNEEKAILVWGGASFTVSVESLKKGWFVPADFGGYKPIRIYIKDGKLYADASIRGSAKHPNIEIRQNQFDVRPSGWDFNSNDRAFEVVDENRSPVFQLIYQRETKIIINGIFPIQENFIYYADESGLRHSFTPLTKNEFSLNPVFRYPSWKYPGIYSE